MKNPSEHEQLSDALTAAVEILRTEFSGTRGSGRDTLTMCELALQLLARTAPGVFVKLRPFQSFRASNC